MKTKLVDFDIEKARNGAKVVAEYIDKDFTRPCRIVCYDAKGEFPIVALIYYECDKGERIHTFNTQGSDNIFNLKIEEPEFENGDIISFGARMNNPIGIFKTYWVEKLIDERGLVNHVSLSDDILFYDDLPCTSLNARLATEEEKQKLFDALKEDGKCWNSEKKCIEELPRNTHEFKPFERVLVRDNCSDKWRANIFQAYDKDSSGNIFYRCINGVYRLCIPYEGNEEWVNTDKTLKFEY